MTTPATRTSSPSWSRLALVKIAEYSTVSPEPKRPMIATSVAGDDQRHRRVKTASLMPAMTVVLRRRFMPLPPVAPGAPSGEYISVDSAGIASAGRPAAPLSSGLVMRRPSGAARVRVRRRPPVSCSNRSSRTPGGARSRRAVGVAAALLVVEVGAVAQVECRATGPAGCPAARSSCGPRVSSYSGRSRWS